jgi:hypothetical protein
LLTSGFDPDHSQRAWNTTLKNQNYNLVHKEWWNLNGDFNTLPSTGITEGCNKQTCCTGCSEAHRYAAFQLSKVC